MLTTFQGQNSPMDNVYYFHHFTKSVNQGCSRFCSFPLKIILFLSIFTSQSCILFSISVSLSLNHMVLKSQKSSYWRRMNFSFHCVACKEYCLVKPPAKQLCIPKVVNLKLEKNSWYHQHMSSIKLWEYICLLKEKLQSKKSY